jgi:hypothetical protein
MVIYETNDKNIIEYLCQIMCNRQQVRQLAKEDSFLNSYELISDLIIKPIFEIRPDLLDVKIFHEATKKHIIVFINFIEYTQSILLIKWPLTDSISNLIV